MLAGGLVVEGTLVVETGTRLHAEDPVVLSPTMQLEIVLLNPYVLENGTVEIIVCMSLSHLLCCVCERLFVLGGSCLKRDTFAHILHFSGAEVVDAAEAGVNGTAAETVRVRKEYSDDECEVVEGSGKVTQQKLLVVLSIENSCSSSDR